MSDASNIEIRAELRDFGHNIALAGLARSQHAVAKPLTMEKIDPGSFAEPFAVLGRTEAQQLMDDLWRCGLRPSEGTGSAGSLRATERHLEDMRTLVFEGGKNG